MGKEEVQKRKKRVKTSSRACMGEEGLFCKKNDIKRRQLDSGRRA